MDREISFHAARMENGKSLEYICPKLEGKKTFK
jgi:hypothetical protein